MYVIRALFDILLPFFAIFMVLLGGICMAISYAMPGNGHILFGAAIAAVGVLSGFCIATKACHT
ncbi:MAG: hypothetical protein NTV36_00620 [Candidatus Staskawiczbacteria bacterium]|nr:hypothetical protein [Candidatus Staskawiczbacteria bacterium]